MANETEPMLQEHIFPTEQDKLDDLARKVITAQYKELNTKIDNLISRIRERKNA